MPYPNQMHFFARLKFASYSLRVPPNWQDPHGDPDADHYGKAFKPEQKTTPPMMAITPPLFSPASANKYHTDTQWMLTVKFDKYMKDMCKAIGSAFNTWQSTATMVGILVNGPTASLGQLMGPPLMPLILAQAPKTTPNLLKYTNVIATVISNAWLQFTATVKIPGLPWYPAFTAIPSPVAPPTPNVPTPFAALTQVPVSISAEIMKQQMILQLGDPMAPYAPQLFGAICDAFEKCYNMWKIKTLVQNVLGTGPVPTFAPPYVPAGPVLAGVGTMSPGGLNDPSGDPMKLELPDPPAYNQEQPPQNPPPENIA